MLFAELRPGDRFVFAVGTTHPGDRAARLDWSGSASGRASVWLKMSACSCNRNAVSINDGSQANVDDHAEVYRIRPEGVKC